MCEALNCRRGMRAARHVFFLLLLGLALPSFAVAQEKKETSSKLLDLNTATVEQLEELPEIGPTTAKAIVRFREKSGPFRRVEDLLAVRGITKRRLAVEVPQARAGLRRFFGVRHKLAARHFSQQQFLHDNQLLRRGTPDKLTV